jgi:hypothetical protein
MPTLVIHEEPAAPAAAGGRGGFVATLRELLELKDRRIQASAFFFACGASVVLHGTVFNRAADNPEHVLVGYGLFTIGAGLGFLTLSGSDRLGHAAYRVEEVLRGFFQ